MLPESPNTGYTSSDPVLSADLDDIQACIVGRKVPNHWRWRAIQRGLLEVNITFDVSGNFGGDIAHANANAAVLTQALDFTVGDRITNIGLNLQGTGAAQTVSLYLMCSDGIGGHHAVEQLDIVNPPGTWAKYTKALVTPETVLDGVAYYFNLHVPLLNTVVQNFGHAMDRL